MEGVEGCCRLRFLQGAASVGASKWSCGWRAEGRFGWGSCFRQTHTCFMQTRASCRLVLHAGLCFMQTHTCFRQTHTCFRQTHTCFRQTHTCASHLAGADQRFGKVGTGCADAQGLGRHCCMARPPPWQLDLSAGGECPSPPQGGTAGKDSKTEPIHFTAGPQCRAPSAPVPPRGREGKRGPPKRSPSISQLGLQNSATSWRAQDKGSFEAWN